MTTFILITVSWWSFFGQFWLTRALDCKYDNLYSPVGLHASLCPVATPNADLELLWIRVDTTSQTSFVGALYNPPNHSYPDIELLDLLESTIEGHLASHPTADVI